MLQDAYEHAECYVKIAHGTPCAYKSMYAENDMNNDNMVADRDKDRQGLLLGLF
jgi:hypothetical protein